MVSGTLVGGALVRGMLVSGALVIGTLEVESSDAINPSYARLRLIRPTLGAFARCDKLSKPVALAPRASHVLAALSKLNLCGKCIFSLATL